MMRVAAVALLAPLLLPQPHAHLRPPPPLVGKVVVVDPGHQLGNARHPHQTARLVDAGGFRKPCNTTGTSTRRGLAEATFNYRVARKLRSRLMDLGATVLMTRTRNSLSLWGPCVDRRGRLGNKRHADLKLSIHADGSGARNRGFHLIVSTRRNGYRVASTSYAKSTRASLQRSGFRRSTYVGGGTALSFRGDLGTLNLSRMPTIIVELGNMRNAKDAASMSSERGQQRYASALARGIRRFLGGR